ncbi:histidine kinase [Neobacillus sp. 3P2-tot-E-2]|uniref:cache domain-containing sensor histidine kinase n=1 Tax=Neobacillus sp. 3P2-tot-E-2 TaxID=3132212 RepID=UPI0039A3CC1C
MQKKLLIQFIILSIVPILLLGAVSVVITYNITKNNAIQFSKEIVHQTTQKIDELLLEVEKSALITAEEPAVQEALRNPISSDIAKKYSQELEINTRLNLIANYNEKLFGIYVIGNNGGRFKSNYGTELTYDINHSLWYKDVVVKRDVTWFSARVGSLLVKTAGEFFISAGYPIKDKASGKISGIVMVDVPEQQLATIAQAKLGEKGYISILDDENSVITHPNRNLITTKLKLDQSKKIITSENTKVIYTASRILIEETSTVTGWKIIGTIPIGELTKDSIVIRNIIILILFLVCSSALFFAYQFSRLTVKPLKDMTHSMKVVEEGNFNVKLPSIGNDEIGQLNTGFNVMIQRIQELMDRVLTEQESLRQAELKSLQYQINPHFLYNTLDSIVWLTRANKNEEAIKMVIAITKLFRIGISRGEDIITLEEEIEHVGSYLTIQHMRYSKKFDYTIEIPKSFHRYKTFKVILQPIVENAIYHGIKLKKEKGHISVSVKDREDHLLLIVKDTGKGMDEETVKRLNNTLKDGPGEKLNIYGLKNVEERIKLFFGEGYGITFHSILGEGTTAEIKIPKMIGE